MSVSRTSRLALAGGVCVLTLLAAACGGSTQSGHSDGPTSSGPTTYHVTARPAPAPQHSVEVHGSGVYAWPGYDPDTERYAITTTDDTDGQVTVDATTSDRNGRVRVDGRLVRDGSIDLTDVSPGDEISVTFDDSGGHSVHSYFVTPVDYPVFATTKNDPSQPVPMLTATVSQYQRGDPDYETPDFQSVFDRNGVPIKVFAFDGQSGDMKRQPNGRITISIPATRKGISGTYLQEYDNQFNELGYTNSSFKNTNGHDSRLMADGSRYVFADVPDDETGLEDAVIQQFDKHDNVIFEWDSGNYIDPDESVVWSDDPNDDLDVRDYMHINSLDFADDGNLIVSFRHLSTVLKIARHPGERADGSSYDTGDVIWRFGGRESDFDIIDDRSKADNGDESVGPCAQHTATLQGDRLLLFDNGSGRSHANRMCINADDPGAHPVSRPWTRIMEYQLDEESMTARVAYKFEDKDRFGYFSGSAWRVKDGILVGWGPDPKAISSIVDRQGRVTWELRDPTSITDPDGFPGPKDPNDHNFYSYRVNPITVPDEIQPEVEVAAPQDGQTFDQGERVRAEFSCTDQGGSSLDYCQTTAVDDDLIDTSQPGDHTFEVTGKDEAGNYRHLEVDYTVR